MFLPPHPLPTLGDTLISDVLMYYTLPQIGLSIAGTRMDLREMKQIKKHTRIISTTPNNTG